MCSNASKTSIVSFLTQAKSLLAAGDYVLWPRRKNMQALAERGLTILDAKSEIMDLEVSDYYKGPKQDFDPDQPGDIWEFKKDIGSEVFYIKLKIQVQNGRTILKCLSFHEDEYS